MKKSVKISLIVIPIVILGVVSLTLFQSENIILFQPENELDNISIDAVDILSLNLPIVGFSDATVIIIAFSDYQCKDCKTWYDEEYQKNLRKSN